MSSIIIYIIYHTSYIIIVIVVTIIAIAILTVAVAVTVGAVGIRQHSLGTSEPAA